MLAHRHLRRLGRCDVADLVALAHHAPLRPGLVEHAHDVGVERLALAEQRVQLELAYIERDYLRINSSELLRK